jgi:hypothetical protein
MLNRFKEREREIMLFIGKPMGRSIMISNRFKHYRPLSIGHSAPHCMFMGTPQLYLLTLHWYSPSVHHTEPAARTIQIQAALLLP